MRSPEPGRNALLDAGQRLLGSADVGQGCVVQQGLVLAVEAIEGTDAMLLRVSDEPLMTMLDWYRVDGSTR